jgi:hypothetical protein
MTQPLILKVTGGGGNDGEADDVADNTAAFIEQVCELIIIPCFIYNKP